MAPCICKRLVRRWSCMKSTGTRTFLEMTSRSVPVFSMLGTTADNVHVSLLAVFTRFLRAGGSRIPRSTFSTSPLYLAVTRSEGLRARISCAGLRRARRCATTGARDGSDSVFPWRCRSCSPLTKSSPSLSWCRGRSPWSFSWFSWWFGAEVDGVEFFGGVCTGTRP